MEEIKIWVKYNTFKRWPRRGNVMTSRYLLKWKLVTNEDGVSVRIIRARMAMRGFQDWYAHLAQTQPKGGLQRSRLPR